MAEILEVPFTTWQDFKDGHVTRLFGKKLFQHGRYIFRGQGDARWPLVSSFDRQFDLIEDRLARHNFGVVLRNTYVNLLGKHEVDIGIPKGAEADDRVVLPFAQHFGLPTRLLDWSENPYVAAFFAFESHFIKPGSKPVAVWALDTKNPVWSSPLGAEIFAPRSLGNARLRNQSGVFTLTYFGMHFNSLEDYVKSIDDQDAPLIKFTIPASEARSAMVDLDSMGVNSGSLFEDAQGLARLAILRALADYLNTFAPNGDKTKAPVSKKMPAKRRAKAKSGGRPAKGRKSG